MNRILHLKNDRNDQSDFNAQLGSLRTAYAKLGWFLADLSILATDSIETAECVRLRNELLIERQAIQFHDELLHFLEGKSDVYHVNYYVYSIKRC